MIRATRGLCRWRPSPAVKVGRLIRTSNISSTTIAPKSQWVGSAGAGGRDLRSDVVTTPTASMLAAIQNCTLRDAVYREDRTTIDLEEHCAKLTGKEAGLLVLSGTMGNQVALRTLLTQPPHGVLCDRRSHIYQYEAGGVSVLTGATMQVATPSNGVYLTLKDIEDNVVIADGGDGWPDVHECPTRVISLENTINGVIMPLTEVRRISAFARTHFIKMHCDGARLWEAVAAGAGRLDEYAACFDTVSLCFSKGLGAPMGSIIVSSADIIKHATWICKMIGGGLRQAGVVAAPARVAVDQTFGTDPSGAGSILKQTHALAKDIARLWTDAGGRLLYPVDTNMVYIDLAASGIRSGDLECMAAQLGLKIYGNRMVVHYQIYENREYVLPRLQQAFRSTLSAPRWADKAPRDIDPTPTALQHKPAGRPKSA